MITSGLSSNEAQALLVKYGENSIDKAREKSLYSTVLDLLKEPMHLLLIAAGAIVSWYEIYKKLQNSK